MSQSGLFTCTAYKSDDTSPSDLNCKSATGHFSFNSPLVFRLSYREYGAICVSQHVFGDASHQQPGKTAAPVRSDHSVRFGHRTSHDEDAAARN